MEDCGIVTCAGGRILYILHNFGIIALVLYHLMFYFQYRLISTKCIHRMQKRHFAF